MDFRPFVHSKLHLEHFPGKGRGFKAISDIKVGTLLIEEEPVAISIGSINKLAMRLLRHPQVMNELYYPPNYPQLRSQLPPVPPSLYLTFYPLARFNLSSCACSIQTMSGPER